MTQGMLVVPKAEKNGIRVCYTKDEIGRFLTYKIRNQEAKAALKKLLDGNIRHVSKYARERSNRNEKLVKTLVQGQQPIATVLACADSRVNPCRIFNQKDGQIFKVENAGNIAYDPVTIGTLEYGVKHTHTPLLLIMGHEFCGAVTATCKCEGKKQKGEGSINYIIESIEPSARRAGYDVESTILLNIFDTIDNIRKNSDIISTYEKEEKVDVIACYYSISTGWFRLLERE
jgi:carbonic anhydrase